MKLLIKTLKEERFEVECEPSDSIASIKEKLAAMVRQEKTHAEQEASLLLQWR